MAYKIIGKEKLMRADGVGKTGGHAKLGRRDSDDTLTVEELITRAKYVILHDKEPTSIQLKDFMSQTELNDGECTLLFNLANRSFYGGSLPGLEELINTLKYINKRQTASPIASRKPVSNKLPDETDLDYVDRILREQDEQEARRQEEFEKEERLRKQTEADDLARLQAEIDSYKEQDEKDRENAFIMCGGFKDVLQPIADFFESDPLHHDTLDPFHTDPLDPLHQDDYLYSDDGHNNDVLHDDSHDF